jgi:hypothetical protein
VITVVGLQLRPEFAGFHHRGSFPYSANIVNNASVGPFTLSLEYGHDTVFPRWSRFVIQRIELLVLCLGFGWAFRAAVQRCRERNSHELRMFSMLLGALGFALYVQAYQREVLDRYYFPCLIAVVFLLASSHTEFRRPNSPRFRLGRALSIICVVPLAWYTVAGLHDYFRWNEARWELARKALTEVEPDNLDGGFEVNGWLNLDYQKRKTTPKHCAGPCRCAENEFNCTDDTYQISVGVGDARDIVASERPNFWMLPDMSLHLTKRRN